MKGSKITYTTEQLAYVKANYKLPRKELAAKFNQAFNTDISTINIGNLCKRKGWSNGNDARFKKGQAYNPKSGAKTANRTSFKKGSKPANYTPIGSERISKDGFIEIKTKEGLRGYTSKNRYLWEIKHGPIPQGMIIKYKDSDPLNCQLDNLFMVTCAENALLRHLNYSNMPQELRETTLAIAKLKAKTLQMNKQLVTN